MSAVDLSGAQWRKTSYSGGAGNGGNCVEVALAGDMIGLRDSKDAGGPVLAVPSARFLAAIKGR